MRVYHASMVRVEHPDVFHSRKFLDFGQGFYITTLREQAIKYAQRFLRRGKEAWLNVYELDEQLVNSSYALKEFEKYDEEWLDFVVASEKEMLLVIMTLFLVVLLMIRCFVLLTCFLLEI